MPDYKDIKQFYSQGQIINIRYYDQSDNSSLISLNKEVISFKGGLEVIESEFKGKYHYKATKYPSYTILVAELVQNTSSESEKPTIVRSLVGVINLGVKRVYYSGENIKLGVIFGLKVDHSYGVRGVTSELTKCIEQLATSKGVQALQIAIEHNNTVALEFYQNMGYKVQSKRILGYDTCSRLIKVSNELIQDDDTALDLNTVEIGVGEVIKLTREYYFQRDFTLVHWTEMFNRGEYCTSVGYVDDYSKRIIAGVSIFKNGSGPVMKHKRYYVPVNWYQNSLLSIAVFGIWTTIVGVASLVASKWIKRFTKHQTIVLSGVVALYGYMQFAEFKKHIIEMTAMEGARLVAPFYFSAEHDPEDKPLVMRSIFTKAYKVAAEYNCGGFFFNYTEKDPFAQSYNITKKSGKFALYKILDDRLPSLAEVSSDPLEFFDFRDS